jgi:D-glycero-D-manno-heptose 1,7-bisphosphate phosphatase
MYSLDDVHRCNERMDELLALPRPIFDGICIAPESSDQPALYRKPSPRYIFEMITLHGLDPTQCWMVGDRDTDIEAGRNAKINAAAVCTGKHDTATWAALAVPGVPVFPRLLEFVATLR